MPWVCLQFVIVVFPDHTHYFTKSQVSLNKVLIGHLTLRFTNIISLCIHKPMISLNAHEALLIYIEDLI